DRNLIHRHGDAAEALRGQLRPIEARAVVADHRQFIAAAEAVGGEPEREIAHLAVILGPGKTLPDAAVLFADRRPAIVSALRRNSRGNVVRLVIIWRPPP